MKKDGKYRFSLQFPAESCDQICVGEFLERLGNRKSAVIVKALKEYLKSHPELKQHDAKIKVQVESEISRRSVEELVRTILDERLAVLALESSNGLISQEGQDALEQDITAMLGNLDMFL